MFYKTSKDEGHTHVAYIGKDGVGLTSTHKGGHSHVYDGQEILESEGHTHELKNPLTAKPKRTQEDDTEITNNVLTLFQEACDIEKDSYETADKCEGFYNGDGQWEKNDTVTLDKQARAALTMNEIAAKIDLLSGYQRQNRQDVRLLPTGAEDAIVAEMGTRLIKNIFTMNDFEHNETQVFDDQTIAGRGTFNAYPSFDDNIEGDIVVERYPWRDVVFGPHEKWDLSDCEYLAKHKKYSRAKVKQLWPDKAEEVDASWDMLAARQQTQVHDSSPGTSYTDDGKTALPVGMLASKLLDIAKKEISVIELWQKEYVNTKILVGNIGEEDVYESTEGWAEKDVSAAETIEGFKAVKRKTYRIRVTQVAGTALLDDDYPDLAKDEFHCVPVYAYRRDGKYWGKIKCAIDPQREFNKRISQVADILNRVSPFGYYYDDETFNDEHDAAQWKADVSRPGFTAKVRDVAKKPVVEEGIRFPGELAAFATTSGQHLASIMNINYDMQGLKSNSESGSAIAYRQKQGLIGNEFLFDNLALAKRRLVKLILAMIKKYYTPERIYRELSAAHARTPFTIPVQGGDTPFSDLDPGAVMRLLEDSDLTKFDVVVSESAYNPSIRQFNFQMWRDYAREGGPVPPDFLIDMSDLPDKEKAKKLFAEYRNQMQANEDKKYETEIQKTLINQQSKIADRQVTGQPPT